MDRASRKLIWQTFCTSSATIFFWLTGITELQKWHDFYIILISIWKCIFYLFYLNFFSFVFLSRVFYHEVDYCVIQHLKQFFHKKGVRSPTSNSTDWHLAIRTRRTYAVCVCTVSTDCYAPICTRRTYANCVCTFSTVRYAPIRTVTVVHNFWTTATTSLSLSSASPMIPTTPLPLLLPLPL